jgi:hypothetical protein
MKNGPPVHPRRAVELRAEARKEKSQPTQTQSVKAYGYFRVKIARRSKAHGRSIADDGGATGMTSCAPVSMDDASLEPRDHPRLEPL